MTRKKWELDRRRFLRTSVGGASTLLGLPLLEAMLPSIARAQASVPVVFVSGYQTMSSGNPSYMCPPVDAQGKLITAGTVYQNLSATEIEYFTALQNISHTSGTSYGHNLGPYGEGKTDSIQTILADYHKQQGYAYDLAALYGHRFNAQGTIKKAGNVVPHENVKTAFDRITAGLTIGQSAQEKQAKQSVLDAVLADLNSLTSRVGVRDRNTLTQYADSIRDIENRLAQINVGCQPISDPGDPRMAASQEIVSEDRAAHSDLMWDLMIMLIQCDLARVISFVFANTGSVNYPRFKINGVEKGTSYRYHDIDHRIDILTPDQSEVHSRDVTDLCFGSIERGMRKAMATPHGSGNVADVIAGIMSWEHAEGGHAHQGFGCGLFGKGGGAITGNRLIKPTPNATDKNVPAKIFDNLVLALARASGWSGTSFGNSQGIIDLSNGLWRSSV